jgi:transposase InsO family protein
MHLRNHAPREGQSALRALEHWQVSLMEERSGRHSTRAGRHRGRVWCARACRNGRRLTALIAHCEPLTDIGDVCGHFVGTKRCSPGDNGRFADALGTRAPTTLARGPNQRWSLDFVFDVLADGRRFRALVVVDDFTRECLALAADTSLSGRRVVRELDRIVELRGAPLVVVSDNGTELTSHAVPGWQQRCGIDWHHIVPGKPVQDGPQPERILVTNEDSSGARSTPIHDQTHRLKLELPCKPPPLHLAPPVPSKHLTQCLKNRGQAKLLSGWQD